MSAPIVEVIDADTISRRVAELGAEIMADYPDGPPVLVMVLHGSVPFGADLIRHMPYEVEADFLALTRFGEEGRVNIAMDTSISLEGRHVLVVEDLVDTGLTLVTMRRLLEARNPASVRVVALLDKAPRRIVDVAVEYRGFEVGDEFLLGYGLDWEGRYRNLPSLWAVLDLVAFTEDPDVLARAAFPPPPDRLAP